MILESLWGERWRSFGGKGLAEFAELGKTLLEGAISLALAVWDRTTTDE